MNKIVKVLEHHTLLHRHYGQCCAAKYAVRLRFAIDTDAYTNVRLIYVYLGQAGAVDEETFVTAFEDVPSVNLFSAKDLEEQMKLIKDHVGDDKKDWKQKIESVRVKMIST